MKSDLLHRIGIMVLVILILFSAAVVLFFAEGGEIRGINHDPNNSKTSLDSQGIVFEVVEEEIVPIYDGTEIKTIELWQMPPKEILRRLIVFPMGYIPPITGQLITFFISCLGLAFIILFHRETRKKDHQDSERPEKILTYITENPGRSIQQIVNGTNIPRSSLRHHLRTTRMKSQIQEFTYCKNPHYFSREKSYTDIEKLVLAVLSSESERPVFIELFNNPKATKQDLAERLNVSESAAHWHLKRLNAAELLVVETDRGQNRYRLSVDAEKTYRKFLQIEAAARAG
ncbi:winged helix-turn-helix transcriptional regulator [Methanorbis rubei]|uniref:HTH arsR-type domain-containing protein n=1 Tax=Methanorbis rubei TaxID=3028300 RepID=A0AAE4SC66_9EURY|nr:hypothetical protein [Methanocorpusculaceae archaeon Cs1]